MFHVYPQLRQLIDDIILEHESRTDSPNGKLKRRGKREKLYPNTNLIWEAAQRKHNGKA